MHSNDRNVRTLINIDNTQCYIQDIPCYYCLGDMELVNKYEYEGTITFIYECVQCSAKVALTYRPFIKDVYCLEHEKWTTK